MLLKGSSTKRRSLARGFVAVLVTAVQVAVAGSALAAEEARLRVLVAADEDQEMFSFQPGTPPGLEREMIEGFVRAHGLRLEVIPVTRFDQIIPNLNARLGDVILGIVDTEKRRAEVSFTDEVLPTRHVVVGVSNRPQVRSLEQLRIQKVGVVTGSSWADAAVTAGIPATRIMAFPETPAMMTALLAGQVQVAVMGISSFALGRKKNPELRADLFLGAPGRHAWAVRKGDVALRDQLNQHIALLKGSGAWGQLLARYLSPDALALFTSARKP
jgi:ABC-type amino acid transport substrate-binding protein